MPKSERGDKRIMVLTDHFTRWAYVQAIPDVSAFMVARTRNQNVFCLFGLPKQIHTDQGAQFPSQLMSNLCKM